MDDRLAVVGRFISGLVSRGMVQPDEPWIRVFLGVPAHDAGAS